MLMCFQSMASTAQKVVEYEKEIEAVQAAADTAASKHRHQQHKVHARTLLTSSSIVV